MQNVEAWTRAACGDGRGCSNSGRRHLEHAQERVASRRRQVRARLISAYMYTYSREPIGAFRATRLQRCHSRHMSTERDKKTRRPDRVGQGHAQPPIHNSHHMCRAWVRVRVYRTIASVLRGQLVLRRLELPTPSKKWARGVSQSREHFKTHDTGQSECLIDSRRTISRVTAERRGGFTV